MVKKDVKSENQMKFVYKVINNLFGNKISLFFVKLELLFTLEKKFYNSELVVFCQMSEPGVSQFWRIAYAIRRT